MADRGTIAPRNVRLAKKNNRIKLQNLESLPENMSLHALDTARGVGTLMCFWGGGFHEAPLWLAPSGNFFLKIEDSKSLEMAISEFYQRLFERSVSSLIEPCVQFLTP